jgi:hypothetical protein
MCTASGAAAADSGIQVTIAIPQNHQGERALKYFSREPFHVIITNSSDTPKRIWQEWCSWGYFALSLELTDENGKTWTATKRTRAWSKNYPDYWTLGPQESLVLDVAFFDSDTWEGFSRPSVPSQKLKMRAIFEVRPDRFSQEHSVWTGRAVSKTDEYVFYK